MANPNTDHGRRWAAAYLANREARRRAREVAKVAGIVIITIMATLVFTGHRLAPHCVGAALCFERVAGGGP